MDKLCGKEFRSLEKFKEFFDQLMKIDRQSFVIRSSYPLTKVRKMEFLNRICEKEVPRFSKILYQCVFGPARESTSNGIRKVKYVLGTYLSQFFDEFIIYTTDICTFLNSN